MIDILSGFAGVILGLVFSVIIFLPLLNVLFRPGDGLSVREEFSWFPQECIRALRSVVSLLPREGR